MGRFSEWPKERTSVEHIINFFIKYIKPKKKNVEGRAGVLDILDAQI